MPLGRPQMEPEEAAARLAGKVQRYEPGVTGAGRNVLTANDIAYGLAQAAKVPDLNHRAISAVVRVKWSGDRSEIWPLLFEVVRTLTKNVMRRNLYVRPGQIERIAAMALLELHIIRVEGYDAKTKVPIYGPGAGKCQTCRGARSRFSKQKRKWFTCVDCGGTGDYQWSEKRRARRTRMPTKIWEKRWARLYRTLLFLIVTWEQRGLYFIWNYSLRRGNKR